MIISPFDLLLLLGSLQGFILATLLWTTLRGHRLSNRLLAGLIGLLALMSLAVGVPVTNRWVSLALDLLPFVVVMPIGPLIYFYAKSVVEPNFRLNRAEQLHFLPVVLDCGAIVIGWVFLLGLFLGFWPRQDGPMWGNVMDDYNTYVDIPRWISMAVYLLMAQRFLVHHQRAADAAPTKEQLDRLRWLRQFVRVLLVFQTIWLIHLVPYTIPALRGPLLNQVGWYPIYVPIAGLIYWLGLRGYLYTRTDTLFKPSPKPTSPELSDETVAQVTRSLIDIMKKEQIFLDPELTVEKVGHRTSLPPKLISAVLNQHLHKNFNGFINEYRVKEVKERINHPACEHLTLAGIAYECGFNSQATFQRAFRQWAGMSPGEFASQQKKNTQIGI